MKFCVIGPAYPLRGGIAQHTGLLCRHLAEKHDVHALTFKRLYPSILFPGRSQTDPSGSPAGFRADPAIDSLNPLAWARAARQIRRMAPDCIVVQWWQPFFGPCLASILWRAGRSKVLFICHNVLPHEASPLAKPLALLALRRGNGFLVHSDEDKTILERLLPGRRVEKTVLPELSMRPRRGIAKAEARKELDVAGRVVLFFGLVRKYKGLMDLIRAVHLLRDTKTTCMVVGEFYDKKEEYLSEITRLGLDGSVRVVDRYVPDEEIEPYFAASDVVVLPYVSATQSGVVPVAYHFERPVIATSVGGLPEAVDDGRTGLLVPPGNPEALAAAIRRYYDEDLEPGFVRAVRAESDRFSWSRVVESIESLEALL